jgi:ADP-ribose pyrophosphatase
MSQREILFTGHKIQLARQTLTAPDGTPLEREMVIHPGAVAVLPWVDADRICLVRNYRWTIDKTLYELPAGTLSPGEEPEHAAARELAEETGYRAGRLTKLIAFYPSPGVMTEVTHLFLAEDLTPGAAHLEADEELRPEVVRWEEALGMLDTGQIVDAKTLVGLMFFERMRRAR